MTYEGLREGCRKIINDELFSNNDFKNRRRVESILRRYIKNNGFEKFSVILDVISKTKIIGVFDINEESERFCFTIITEGNV